MNPSQISSYADARRFLLGHVDVERMRVIRSIDDTFKLDRIRSLLKKLGNPQESMPLIHIAGTKGKGSTVAMLASALHGAGLAVGAFTSPHLVDLRERIRIDDVNIAPDEFAKLTAEVGVASDAIVDEHGRPQYFELLTAMAFLHFAQKAVDVAVIEVGLGGRLDCTNVIDPMACGITQISLDHMNILGDTLAAIAAEKAGILKPGVPAASTPQPPEVAEVLRQVAASVGCELRILGEEIEFTQRFEATRNRGPHSQIALITPTSSFEHIPVPLAGEHQAWNCGLALAIIDVMRARGWDLPEDQIEDGLAATRLEGRLELIRPAPRLVIDGAHNADSIRALMRSLGPEFPYDSLVVIFGCGVDKDVQGMLQALATGADKIIFTRARSNPRAMDPDELQTRFARLSGKMTQTAPSLAVAFDLAERAVGREDLICVTGSFYLAGEAKKEFGSPPPIEPKTSSQAKVADPSESATLKRK